MSNKQKQNLLGSTTVLVFSTILVKIIGAIYKIPLGNLITATGNGYFWTAYEIYTPIYTISMAGLPIAVSRLVSESIAAGKYRQAKQVFDVSRKIFLLVGSVGTIVLLAVAYPYSYFLIETPKNLPSILCIAPCVLFCCIMSSYRGFYEGTRNMYPTGISQVIEALGKVIFGLSLSYVVIKYGLKVFANGNGSEVKVFGELVNSEEQALSAIYPYAAAAAILGVTLGSVIGMFYLIIRSRLKGSVFTREELVNSPMPSTKKETIKEIVRIAIPVAFSSMVLTVTNFIDTLTIKTRLNDALKSGGDLIRQMYENSLSLDKVVATGAEGAANISNYLVGVYGFALNLKNLIPTITMSLGVSVLPILSAAWANKNREETKSSIESSLKMCMLIGMPASFGMAALATPIIDLLYGANNPGAVPIGGKILFLYALPIFIFALSSPLTNMLNAVNKMSIPLIAVAIGAVIKILINYILIGNPAINIMGAPISSLVCYTIIVAINLVFLLNTVKVKLNFVNIFLKPLIAGVLCGGSAYGVYYILSNVLNKGNTVSTLVSVCFGGLIYFIMLIILKGFTKNDVEMLPKGEKIAKVLEKFKVLG